MEAAEASIRVAKEATEASKKAAREAAETSVRVFQELIGGAGGIGKTSKQVVKQTIDTLAETSQEGDAKTKETDKASEETDEVLTKAFGGLINITEADANGKREAREVQRKIEARMESLASMFASIKDKPAEEEEEE